MRLLRGPGGRHLVVINPMSRMGKGLRTALWTISRLVEKKVDFEAVLTKTAGHAERIVAEYERDVDVVVAVGGDGTVNEVINGIMKREKRPALAVVPAGRGNDFSVLLGIGRSRRRALKYLLSEDLSTVDLLRFNGRYAGNVVGIGLDAAVQEKSWHYRYLPVPRYLLNLVLLLLRGADRIPMRIEYAGGAAEGEYLVAVVGHSRKFARHIRLFPGLKLDGGVMKFATVKPMNRFISVVEVFSAGMCFAGIYPQVAIRQSPWVEITVGVTAKAQSDGDLFFLGRGETLRVELVRQALRVKGSIP